MPRVTLSSVPGLKLPATRSGPYLALVVALAASGCELAGAGDIADPRARTARQELRIGSVADPATMLTTFDAMAVGPDGRIYTLHPQEKEVRIHDAEGNPLRAIGGDGGGPGEFRSPRRMAIRGDTLWVLDYSGYRFTLFHTSGDLLGTRTPTVDLGTADETPPRPGGMLSDGTIWGSSMSWSHLVADGTITERVAVRFDSAGAIRDTMIRHSIANTVWELHDPASPTGLRMSRMQPFGAAELVTVSENRPEVVIVERPIAVDPTRGEFRVTKLGLDGDTIFTSAFAYVPRAIPEDLPDSLARDFARPPDLPPRMARNFPPPARALELARASLFAPDYYPPVSALVVGRDGTIWLQREDVGGDSREWWTLDEDGSLIGAVSLPSGLNVMVAERNRIWGLETDDLDVPYILRYVVDRD